MGLTLVLPKTATRDSVSNALLLLSNEAVTESAAPVISLKNTEFVDIAGLLTLTAFMRARKKETGKLLQIAPPDSFAVRDFLVLWRYPETIATALEAAPEEIFTGSTRWLREDPHQYLRKSDGIGALELDPVWKRQSGSQRNFFEFLTFKLDTSDPADAYDFPRVEAARWQGILIKSVLARHLRDVDSGDEDHISRVVVFEAMANAVQHPRATMVQVGSIFQSEPDQRTSSHFRLCIWDDGESMISTLASALATPNIAVRASGWHAAWNDYIQTKVFDIDLQGGQTVAEEYRFDQKVDPVRGDSDDRLLLSCFSPAVTSAFAKPARPVQGLQLNSATPSAGMGLYTLLRTMVDRYHGQLTVRTSRYLLRLRAARGFRGTVPEARYEAEIFRRPQKENPFLGNLFTMTIPAAR